MIVIIFIMLMITTIIIVILLITYMCIYVYVCMCVYTYMYIHMCVYIYIYIHMYTSKVSQADEQRLRKRSCQLRSSVHSTHLEAQRRFRFPDFLS